MKVVLHCQVFPYEGDHFCVRRAVEMPYLEFGMAVFAARPAAAFWSEPHYVRRLWWDEQQPDVVHAGLGRDYWRRSEVEGASREAFTRDGLLAGRYAGWEVETGPAVFRYAE